jgi:predicted acylesterase/phospholipase RssA
MRRPLCCVVLALLPWLGGCGMLPFYSHSNEASDGDGFEVPRPVENIVRVFSLRPPLPQKIPSGVEKAALDHVPWQVHANCRTQAPSLDNSAKLPEHCRDTRFVALTLSGGGSRASVFGAAAMFEMERYGLLDHVDLLSCVSGGCLTAAYYALSCNDPDDPATCPPTTNGSARYAWNEQTLYPLLQRSLLWRWFGNWFWPHNILRFWFTYYDRTDIMAATLSNNLYDHSVLANNQFRFRDLNPTRPNLAINATDVTSTTDDGFHFPFSPERFKTIRSDLDRYPIANAVMASASFPGAFNYVTLRDYSRIDSPRYVHLTDGGAYDNLGLNAIKTAMESPANAGPRLRAVIIIDAYPAADDRLAYKPDQRGWFDFFLDTNFFVAYDTLLTSLRRTQLGYAQTLLKEVKGELLHLSWQKLNDDPEHHELAKRLNRVPTSLNISDTDASCVKRAAQILVRRELDAILTNRTHPLRDLLTPPKETPALHPCPTGQPAVQAATPDKPEP